MRQNSAPLLVSSDPGLLRHWRSALGIESPIELGSFAALKGLVRRTGDIVWLDLAVADIPPWSDPVWNELLQQKKLRILAASSYPKDEEAMIALDRGCAGYCHAFADPETLLQVHQVTSADHVWIGQQLMQQLIQRANSAMPVNKSVPTHWAEQLTSREREIASLAAHGATNAVIAAQCDITERTVKAHLSAVFEKLNVTDRLQLALKVHGIQ